MLCDFFLLKLYVLVLGAVKSESRVKKCKLAEGSVT
jgi:hypothetical protein